MFSVLKTVNSSVRLMLAPPEYIRQAESSVSQISSLLSPRESTTREPSALQDWRSTLHSSARLGWNVSVGRANTIVGQINQCTL